MKRFLLVSSAVIYVAVMLTDDVLIIEKSSKNGYGDVTSIAQISKEIQPVKFMALSDLEAPGVYFLGYRETEKTVYLLEREAVGSGFRFGTWKVKPPSEP